MRAIDKMDSIRIVKSKIKVLFMVETVTLAHIARSSSLARSLDPEKFDVTFSFGQAPAMKLPQLDSLQLRRLKTCVDSKLFIRSLANGKLPYTFEVIQSQVEEDLQILNEVKPDVVIGDFRLSLSISSQLVNVPYVNISNSTWADAKTIQVPDLPVVRFFGENIAKKVFKIIQPLIFRQLVKPFNLVAKKYNVESQRSLMDYYCGGDYTFFADLPGLIESEGLAKNWYEIGPIKFEAEMPPPNWTSNISKDLPLVYVNMGSSGDGRVLERIVEGLLLLPVTVVLGRAGEKINLPKNDRLFSEDYLPSNAFLKRADLFIGNGGSLSGYAALAEGVPVLSIPSNLDQMNFSQAIVNLGGGRRLRIEQVTSQQIKTTVSEMLNSSTLKENVSKLKAKIEKTDAFRFLDQFLSDHFACGDLSKQAQKNQ